MNKRKQQSSQIGRRSMVALLALVMLISVCAPGLTARASTVDTESTESTTIPVETTAQQETELEETVEGAILPVDTTLEETVLPIEAMPEGIELFGENEPENAEEADAAQDPEITALYDQIMAYTDIESYWAFLGTMSEDEQSALFEQFTVEQMDAITKHVDFLTENAQSAYDAEDVLAKLTATGTYTELVSVLGSLSAEDKAFMNAFTEDQTAALNDHISGLVNGQFANVTLTLSDNNLIITDGRISVTPSVAAPEGITYVYTWQKNGANITRTAYDNDGDGENIEYTVGENGEWVNAVLIQGSDTNPGAETTYTVKLTGVKIDGLDEIYDVENANQATKASPYVAQLRNGSFETPDVVRQTMVDDRDENGLYWKTTDTTDHDIEIITELRDKSNPDTIAGIVGYPLQSQYDANHNHDAYWHGVMFMPQGDQCAEINANREAALYQDVMTIPGVEMNWAFDHMGRPISSGTILGNGTATDSMYVVIMSTQLANSAGNGGGPVDTYAEVEAVKTRIDNNAPGYEGAKVIDISYSWVWLDVTPELNEADGIEPTNSFNGGKRMYRVNADETLTPIYTLYNNRLYQHNDPWVIHADMYEVPDGQYMTRFFFVANSTSSGNTTMGNHIDNVWFAQEPRPAESGAANLIIKKELDGLTSGADIEAAKASLNFTVTVNGKESTVLGTQLTWDGTVGTYAVPTTSFYQSSISFTVIENVAANDMFELSAADVSSSDSGTTVKNDEKSAAGSLAKGETETISFKNTYEPTVTSVTITKEVKGNMGDLNKEFSFTVSYGDIRETFTLSDGNSKTIENVPIGTTLTITEDSGVYKMSADKGTVKDSTLTYKVESADAVTITVTNTHNANIDTGVFLDSMPYVLLLSVAAVGAFALLLNKRRYTGKF